MLGVPMLSEDSLAGVFCSQQARGAKPFTDKQIALVTTFADQAVIAIENIAVASRTPKPKPRSNRGIGAADGDERDSARDRQLADRRAAGVGYCGGECGPAM